MKQLLASLLSFTLAVGPVVAVADHEAHTPNSEKPENLKKAEDAPKPPPNEKTPSPQEAANADEETRHWITQQIWGTELGKMYSHFLFDEATPEQNLRRAHELVERLYSNVLISMQRVAGIYLMNADLFNSGRVDPVINDRVGLVMANIGLRQVAQEKAAAKEMGWQIPAIVLFGILAGSKVWQTHAKAITRSVRKNLTWWVLRHGREEAMAARRVVRELPTRELFNWSKFEAGYSTPAAVTSGLGAFLFYTPWYYQIRIGNPNAATPVQKTIIYNTQQLLTDLSTL